MRKQEKMKQKFHFKNLTLFTGIALILGISITFAVIDILASSGDFNFYSERLRSEFINNQKKMIKQEVLQVAELISHEQAQSEIVTKETIRQRVNEASAIAKNIYEQNKTTSDRKTIIKMITDALRPIRFNNGTGYYFMVDLNGIAYLHGNTPEFEQNNLKTLQDIKGKYVIQDMVDIASTNGEGFYQYHWNKPGSKHNGFQKISYVKRIDPLHCFIGAGLYRSDMEQDIKEKLLENISRIRFGKEGYIFINRLNGDALVSNGKAIKGKQKLWEVFSKNPEQMKKIFAKEYNAATTPDGDYIYYTHVKLTTPDIESPKTSFILGLPKLQWLIGAGVYLDDVESEIGIMQEHLRDREKQKLRSLIIFTLAVMFLFLLLFRQFTNRTTGDIDTITSFLKNISSSKQAIKREQIKFQEFDEIAKDINTMFREKILVQQQLIDEQIALSQSEEKFRHTMDSTLIGVYIIQDLVFRYVNPAMTKMFGYSEEEMLQMSPLDLVVPVQWEQVQENLIRRAAGDLNTITDIKCVRKDGEIFDTMALGAATIHEGKPASVGTMIDITDRKAAENELKRSNKRATALLEAIPDIVFRMNGEGVYIDVKAETTDLNLKYYDRVVGKSCFTILPPDVASLIAKQIKSTIQSGDMHTIEYQLGTREQKISDYEARMVKSGDNEVTLIVRNITELKQAAKEKEVLEKQLNQSKRMESIGLMAGGVAHDLNNILSGVVGHPDLILRNLPSDSSIRKPIEAIRDSGLRAAAIVDDLLTVARGVAGTRTIYALNDLILQYLDSLEFAKLKSLYPQVRVVHDLRADHDKISCSQAHIKKCIMNLVTNGVEAMEHVGKVLISTDELQVNEQLALEKGMDAGNYIRLMVIDDGPGISKQDIEHIFEPFYSKKSLARSGTGLGLTVVWNTVENHNGKVFVSSDSSGTTFELFFPLEQAISETPLPNSVENGKALFTGSGQHILVVDDEILLRNVASEMLRSLGYSVDVVASGEEAIAFSKNTKVDLLLIDMLMEPGINGLQTYKEIKNIHPDQKAIIVSGFSNNDDIQSCIKIGAHDFLKKPYTMKQLSETIDKALRA